MTDTTDTTNVPTIARAKPRAEAMAGYEVETVPLADLRPAKVNDIIYKPVDPSDPAIADLAESVRRNGLLEPITATLCGTILSGHRRYAACRLAGLKEARVRRVAIDPNGPGFVRLLVAFNQQRVKGGDEVIREELARADPTEARARLVAHRAKAAAVRVEAVALRGESKRATISAAKVPFLKAVQRVIEADADFWPMSVRQVHYRLLNDPPLTHAGKKGSAYRNDEKSYKSLIDLLTRARTEGRVPFEAIDDPTRSVELGDFHAGVGPFFRREMHWFLAGYRRDLMLSQPCHFELVAEKNTVAGIVRPVALEYAIPFTIGRGYASLPPRQKMAERFKRSGKARLVVLFASDFDPEGVDIPHSFARSLRDDFGLGGSVSAVRLALNREHVAEFGLAPQMKAKAGSSRKGRFVAGENGCEDVYELESVPPAELRRVIDEGICGVIDIDAYNAEVEAEGVDAAHLEATKAAMVAALSGLPGLNPTMVESGDGEGE